MITDHFINLRYAGAESPHHLALQRGELTQIAPWIAVPTATWRQWVRHETTIRQSSRCRVERPPRRPHRQIGRAAVGNVGNFYGRGGGGVSGAFGKRAPTQAHPERLPVPPSKVPSRIHGVDSGCARHESCPHLP